MAEAIATEATATDGFRRATDAMRDTTKWLVTIVPGASAATVIVQIAPALGSVRRQSSAFDGLVLLLVAAVVAIAITVAMAAYVLETQVPGLGDAMKMAKTSPTFVSDLAEQGVLRLYGYTTGTFFKALAEEPSAGANLGNLQKAATVVADVATHRQTRTRFRLFLGAWALMLVVVLVSGVLAERIRADARTVRVTSPTPVRLIPTASGSEALAQRSCIAVAGTPIPAWAVVSIPANPYTQSGVFVHTAEL